MIYKGTDLKWIVPHIYLLSDTQSVIYIIAPWIDVEVEFSFTWLYAPKTFSLLEIADKFRERNIQTVFIFSKEEEDNNINVKSIRTLSMHNFQFYFVRNLHAKAIVGQRIMYIGSANITYSGMNRNAEAVTIERVVSQYNSLSQLIGGSEIWQKMKMR